VIESGAFSVPGVRGSTPGTAPDVSQGLALAVPSGDAGGQSGRGAEYGAYLGRLRQRVQQALGYPLAARRRGLSGTVHVDLIIRPDGAISGVAVADSSSHAVLDDAAVEAIKRLAPEPFPPDVQARTLRVRLPVVFALE
jgi:periplasmic protein TonB